MAATISDNATSTRDDFADLPSLIDRHDNIMSETHPMPNQTLPQHPTSTHNHAETTSQHTSTNTSHNDTSHSKENQHSNQLLMAAQLWRNALRCPTSSDHAHRPIQSSTSNLRINHPW